MSGDIERSSFDFQRKVAESIDNLSTKKLYLSISEVIDNNTFSIDEQVKCKLKKRMSDRKEKPEWDSRLKNQTDRDSIVLSIATTLFIMMETVMKKKRINMALPEDLTVLTNNLQRDKSNEKMSALDRLSMEMHHCSLQLTSAAQEFNHSFLQEAYPDSLFHMFLVIHTHLTDFYLCFQNFLNLSQTSKLAIREQGVLEQNLLCNKNNVRSQFQNQLIVVQNVSKTLSDSVLKLCRDEYQSMKRQYSGCSNNQGESKKFDHSSIFLLRHFTEIEAQVHKFRRNAIFHRPHLLVALPRQDDTKFKHRQKLKLFGSSFSRFHEKNVEETLKKVIYHLKMLESSLNTKLPEINQLISSFSLIVYHIFSFWDSITHIQIFDSELGNSEKRNSEIERIFGIVHWVLFFFVCIQENSLTLPTNQSEIFKNGINFYLETSLLIQNSLKEK